MTGNQAYYDAPNGSGNRYVSGDVITTAGTYYIFDNDPSCGSSEVSFTITLTEAPDLVNPGDFSSCDSLILPAINGTNLSGNEAYYSSSGGTGTRYLPGEIIRGSGLFYLYDEIVGCGSDEESFQINIDPVLELDTMPDTLACQMFILPAITGNSLSGQQAYFTEANGMGDTLMMGDTIRGSRKLFVYDQRGSCSIQDSFLITIDTLPVISAMLTLPTCNGGNDGLINLNITGKGPFEIDWNVDAFDGQNTASDLSAGNYQVLVTDSLMCSVDTSFTLSEPELLELNCSPGDPISTIGNNDGSINLSFSGGTPPYNISWTGPTKW